MTEEEPRTITGPTVELHVIEKDETTQFVVKEFTVKIGAHPDTSTKEVVEIAREEMKKLRE